MLYGMHFSGLEKSFACVKRIVSHDKVDVPSQAPKLIADHLLIEIINNTKDVS